MFLNLRGSLDIPFPGVGTSIADPHAGATMHSQDIQLGILGGSMNNDSSLGSGHGQQESEYQDVHSVSGV